MTRQVIQQARVYYVYQGISGRETGEGRTRNVQSLETDTMVYCFAGNPRQVLGSWDVLRDHVHIGHHCLIGYFGGLRSGTSRCTTFASLFGCHTIVYCCRTSISLPTGFDSRRCDRLQCQLTSLSRSRCEILNLNFSYRNIAPNKLVKKDHMYVL